MNLAYCKVPPPPRPLPQCLQQRPQGDPHVRDPVPECGGELTASLPTPADQIRNTLGGHESEGNLKKNCFVLFVKKLFKNNIDCH